MVGTWAVETIWGLAAATACFALKLGRLTDRRHELASAVRPAAVAPEAVLAVVVPEAVALAAEAPEAAVLAAVAPAAAVPEARRRLFWWR